MWDRFQRINGFYSELEKKVLVVTGNSELMDDLKQLRYERVKADYTPEEKFTRKRASDCLEDAKSIIQEIRRR